MAGFLRLHFSAPHSRRYNFSRGPCVPRREPAMGKCSIDRLLIGIVVTVTVVAVREASAQAVTVQQPAVRSFSASTTVSVPDRGSTRLGSMGTASSGRVSTGPFRPGNSIGSERTGSAMTVHVFIHDLQAMDEALLAQGRPHDEEADPWSSRLAERRAATRFGVTSHPASESKVKAARYEQLARDAEAKQKPSTARLHWQMAAKLGSSIAEQRLANLKP